MQQTFSHLHISLIRSLFHFVIPSSIIFHSSSCEIPHAYFFIEDAKLLSLEFFFLVFSPFLFFSMPIHISSLPLQRSLSHCRIFEPLSLWHLFCYFWMQHFAIVEISIGISGSPKQSILYNLFLKKIEEQGTSQSHCFLQMRKLQTETRMFYYISMAEEYVSALITRQNEHPTPRK